MTDHGEHATLALRRYAESLAERIVAAAGREAVTAIFAGGSLARGAVVWFEGDETEILSDVDLYVVARDQHATEVRRASSDAVKTVTAESGIRLLRSTDIGVVTMDGLLSEPARPGTIDLPRTHLMLYGDESIFETLARAMGEEIDPSEGLYLIENRLVEIPLSPAADPTSRRLYRYQLLKTVLDVVSGFLVGQGSFRTDLDEGLTEVERLGQEGRLPTLWDTDLVEAAVKGRGALIRYLAASENDAICADRVRRFAIDTWIEIARGIYDEPDPGIATLVLRRCRIGAYKRNFREFLAMSARWGGARSRRAWTAVHLSRYSPLAALRLGPVVAALLERDDIEAVERRSLEGIWRYLDRLTEACGWTEGTLDDRVRAACKSAQSG